MTAASASSAAGQLCRSNCLGFSCKGPDVLPRTSRVLSPSMRLMSGWLKQKPPAIGSPQSLHSLHVSELTSVFLAAAQPEQSAGLPPLRLGGASWPEAPALGQQSHIDRLKHQLIFEICHFGWVAYWMPQALSQKKRCFWPYLPGLIFTFSTPSTWRKKTGGEAPTLAGTVAVWKDPHLDLVGSFSTAWTHQCLKVRADQKSSRDFKKPTKALWTMYAGVSLSPFRSLAFFDSLGSPNGSLWLWSNARNSPRSLEVLPGLQTSNSCWSHVQRIPVFGFQESGSQRVWAAWNLVSFPWAWPERQELHQMGSWHHFVGVEPVEKCDFPLDHSPETCNP